MLKLSTNYVTMTTSILLIVIVTLTLTITITTSSTIGKKKYFSGYKFSTFKGTRFLPNSFNSNNKPQNDRVAVGTMDLPTVGCGTISWFANNLQQKQQLQELLTISTEIKLNFFDTAERYGASRVEAFGGDWGGCESLLGETIANSFGNTDGVDTTNSSDKVKSAGAIESGISTSPTKKSNKFNSCNSGNSPNKNENKLIVGTKFTPTPWRLDANSVVKACADSRKRLGVDSIDLYQIHMPDIVQPLRIFGIENVKDELYWDGMIECYR